MFGEIYLCRFPFTDGVGAKIRPALVLFDLGEDAIICRVTSQIANGPLIFPMPEWRAAGLIKASCAKLDRIITAEKTVFMKKLGQLSEVNLAAVRESWNAGMRL